LTDADAGLAGVCTRTISEKEPDEIELRESAAIFVGDGGGRIRTSVG
jgi:hypothetical protein